MYNAPLVIRSHFHTAKEASEAHAQLENIGVFGDTHTNKEHESFTVLFFESLNTNLAKNSLRRIQTRPFLVEYYDTNVGQDEGWPTFKTLTVNY